jgi:hypothetical protein
MDTCLKRWPDASGPEEGDGDSSSGEKEDEEEESTAKVAEKSRGQRQKVQSDGRLGPAKRGKKTSSSLSNVKRRGVEPKLESSQRVTRALPISPRVSSVVSCYAFAGNLINNRCEGGKKICEFKGIYCAIQ